MRNERLSRAIKFKRKKNKHSRVERKVCLLAPKNNDFYLSLGIQESKEQQTRSSRKILKYSMRTVHNANSKKGFRYLVNNNFSGTPFLCTFVFGFVFVSAHSFVFVLVTCFYSFQKKKSNILLRKKRRYRYKEVHRRVKL